MRLKIQPEDEGPKGLEFYQTVKEGMLGLNKEGKLTSPSWPAHSYRQCSRAGMSPEPSDFPHGSSEI